MATNKGKRLRSKKSILFVRPDFHCSFFYRDEFRRLGWKAEIYVPGDYPKKLLYSEEDILEIPKLKILKFFNVFISIIWWLKTFWQFEYHLYYGPSPAINFLENRLKIKNFLGEDFSFEFWLSKLFRVKLLYLPTGCLDDDLKETWHSFDGGKVCDNCGFFDRCDDIANKIKFACLNRYFDFFIGFGFKNSLQIKETHIKYKSIDLKLWKPKLVIPEEFLLPKTNNLRILHSSFLKNSGRDFGNRNIKGSPFIHSAVQRLKSEGFAVEYLEIENVASKNMRFYQAQSDIVVDQLIFGSWGSTSVEALALGKPVVCYLRPSFKESFLKIFPEYIVLPLIEADTDSIYNVLKKLVSDKKFRKDKEIESRKFAEAHFDPQRNILDFIDHLKDPEKQNHIN